MWKNNYLAGVLPLPGVASVTGVALPFKAAIIKSLRNAADRNTHKKSPVTGVATVTPATPAFRGVWPTRQEKLNLLAKALAIT